MYTGTIGLDETFQHLVTKKTQSSLRERKGGEGGKISSKGLLRTEMKKSNRRNNAFSRDSKYTRTSVFYGTRC